MKAPPSLGMNPTQAEIDTYLGFWQTRAEAIAKLMGDGWSVFGFDPNISLRRPAEGGIYRGIIDVPLEVAECMLRLAKQDI